MEFGVLGSNKDREHNGLGFGEMSKLFATKNTFVVGSASFRRI